MNLFQTFKKVVRHLFGKTNVSKAFGIEIAVSSRMEEALELWR